MHYEEEDLYNIGEEDLPTFVSPEEISRLRNYAHMSSEEYDRYVAGSSAMTGMDDLRITSGTGMTFSVREHRPDLASEADSLHQRWTHIDSALHVAVPTDNGNGNGNRDHYNMMSVEDAEDPLGSLRMRSGIVNTGVESDSAHAIHAGCGESKRDDYSSAIPTVHNHSHRILGSDPAAPPPPAMTAVEREAALFSWRYPLLYESMLLTAGREDMLMAAMRILEEGNPDTHVNDSNKVISIPHEGNTVTGHNSSLAVQRFKEAARFVEYEIGGIN